MRCLLWKQDKEERFAGTEDHSECERGIPCFLGIINEFLLQPEYLESKQ